MDPCHIEAREKNKWIKSIDKIDRKMMEQTTDELWRVCVCAQVEVFIFIDKWFDLIAVLYVHLFAERRASICKIWIGAFTLEIWNEMNESTWMTNYQMKPWLWLSQGGFADWQAVKMLRIFFFSLRVWTLSTGNKVNHITAIKCTCQPGLGPIEIGICRCRAAFSLVCFFASRCPNWNT